MANRAKVTNHARVLQLAIENPEMSDGAIAATVGVSRQLVSRWRKPLRKAAATAATSSGLPDELAGRLAGPPTPTPQPATPSYPLVSLRDLAANEQVEVMLVKILRGSAPRAAAISVGIEPRDFSRRMESDEKFRSLVLRAAHEAEGSVAESLYMQAIGKSPQSVQAAIAWLEKRHPEIWGREPQRIEVEVAGSVDVKHMLSDQRLIELANETEARMQQIEQQIEDGLIVEGEFRELPAHEVEPRVIEVPPLPQDDPMSTSNRVEVAPRSNRPGMQGAPAGIVHMREVAVDGIKTLVADERAKDEERPLAI